MSDAPRLPAVAHHLVWDRGTPIETGETVLFDAHPALIGLTEEQFSRAARQILGGSGHDYDELALSSPRTQTWFRSHWTHGFRVEVTRDDFLEWLDLHGIDQEEACDMDDDRRCRMIEAVENAIAREAPGAPAF